MNSDVIIRDARESDMPFFWSSTLNHFKHSATATKNIPASIYFWHEQKIIEKMLKRAGSFIRMAALRDDDETVLGFVWGNEAPQTLHYLYVKRAFRLMGIAKQLCDESFDDIDQIYVSRMSYDGARLIGKYKQLVYNPYVMNEDIWNHYQSILDEDEDGLKRLFRPHLYMNQE